MAFTLPIIPPSTWELYKKYWSRIVNSTALSEHLIIFEKDSLLWSEYSKKTIKWGMETKTMGCIVGYSWTPQKDSAVMVIHLPHLFTQENLQEVQSWIDWWRPETSIYFRSQQGGVGKCFIQTEYWTWFADLTAEAKCPDPEIVPFIISPFTHKASRINHD